MSVGWPIYTTMHHSLLSRCLRWFLHLCESSHRTRENLWPRHNSFVCRNAIGYPYVRGSLVRGQNFDLQGHNFKFLWRKKATLRELQSLLWSSKFCMFGDLARPSLSAQIHPPSNWHPVTIPFHSLATGSAGWFTSLVGLFGRIYWQIFCPWGWMVVCFRAFSSFTDASGSLGFRTIFQNHLCYGSWPSSWASFNIASYFSCFHQFVSLW